MVQDRYNLKEFLHNFSIQTGVQVDASEGHIFHYTQNSLFSSELSQKHVFNNRINTGVLGITGFHWNSYCFDYCLCSKLDLNSQKCKILMTEKQQQISAPKNPHRFMLMLICVIT